MGYNREFTYESGYDLLTSSVSSTDLFASNVKINQQILKTLESLLEEVKELSAQNKQIMNMMQNLCANKEGSPLTEKVLKVLRPDPVIPEKEAPLPEETAASDAFQEVFLSRINPTQVGDQMITEEDDDS